MEDFFQSTLLREERRIISVIPSLKNVFSIHAPTRGATFWLCATLMVQKFFNPRSYARSDRNCYGKSNPRFSFQSTLLREERLDSALLAHWACSFSIHAPTRGATDLNIAKCILLIFSIHAPTRGATGDSPALSGINRFSIHAPTRGATAAQRLL